MHPQLLRKFDKKDLANPTIREYQRKLASTFQTEERKMIDKRKLHSNSPILLFAKKIKNKRQFFCSLVFTSDREEDFFGISAFKKIVTPKL